MTDYQKTVMRQYANSATLVALLDEFDSWVDPTKFTDDFLLNVWDIDTAVGFGLDIWGRILGRDRFLSVAQTPGFNFGFDIGATPGTNWQPFGQAPFFNGQAPGNVSFRLEDADYRKLLLIKAAANIARCDCPSLNAILRALFPRRAYVGYDPNNPMHVGFTFDLIPNAIQKAIIESGVIPQPAGTITTYIYKTLAYAPFGFAGMNAGANPNYVTGFNQNPFYNP